MVASQGSQDAVWFLGPVPPPVTGITMMTGEVLRALQAVGPVHFLNWSPEANRLGILFRLRRFARAASSIVTLATHGRVQNKKLYLTANSSGAGLLITAVVVTLARYLGYRVYLHHHSYAYIDRYDLRMAWIDRTLGDRGIHIVHANQMIDDFRAQYSTRCEFTTIYPSIVLRAVGRAKNLPNKPFCLGHLSNLSPAKGLDLVLKTFESLCLRGYSVRLKVAGPFHTMSAKSMVQEALGRFGKLIEYVGPVYGEAKMSFFNELDAFLFPTCYKHESWGIVLHEALSAGVPVITLDRGCTRTVVGGKAGLVLNSSTDFVTLASRQIEQWIDRPDIYRIASHAAIDQAVHLHREGIRQLRDFAEQMFAPAVSKIVSEYQS